MPQHAPFLAVNVAGGGKPSSSTGICWLWLAEDKKRLSRWIPSLSRRSGVHAAPPLPEPRPKGGGFGHRAGTSSTRKESFPLPLRGECRASIYLSQALPMQLPNFACGSCFRSAIETRAIGEAHGCLKSAYLGRHAHRQAHHGIITTCLLRLDVRELHRVQGETHDGWSTDACSEVLSDPASSLP